MLGTVLMCLAFVFLLFAAISWPVEGRIKFGWLGMTFWAASILFSGPLQSIFRAFIVVSFAIGLLAMATPAGATGVHAVAAVAGVKAGGLHIAAVGGGAAGAVVAGCIGAVGLAVLWCALNQPNRDMRHDTWVDGRADAKPSYKPRKYGCLFKGPRVISVRG